MKNILEMYERARELDEEAQRAATWKTMTKEEVATMPNEPIDELLKNRGKVHGDWELNATVQALLKAKVREGLKYRNSAGLFPLHVKQEQAIEMICVKMARIIAGDPNHADHWDDIAGYAMLGKGNK